MTDVLLDTNVVSYFLKNHPFGRRYLGLLSRPEVVLGISFQTVAELYEGAFRAGWGPAKLQRLEAAIDAYFVIPSSPAVAKEWGAIRAERRQRPIAPDDAWIAACARSHGYVLVTHDPDDFSGISGLSLLTIDDDGREIVTRDDG